LLDAFGKSFQEPCLPPGKIDPSVRYSSAITSGSPLKVRALAWATRLWGMRSVKVKVGTKRDDEGLRIAHRILGDDVQLRVDANGIWSGEETMDWLGHNMLKSLVAIEQPVAADDLSGLKRLTNDAGLDIIVDESLRDLEDAKRLSDGGCCTVFNVRISKCGGLLQSLKIAHLAVDRGLKVQIGCQVGESSILSAAGLRLLGLLGSVQFLEGCFGTLLLKRELVLRPLRFGRGGVPPSVPASSGLGVEVLEERVRLLATHLGNT